jgi:unsaturated rhamnogalacturonyl hydrolase
MFKFRINKLVKWSAFGLITLLAVNCSGQEPLTAKKLIDNFLKLHPDTVAYKTEAKSYNWNYEQGLILQSYYEMWKETGEHKYFDYIKKNIDYYVQDDGNIKTYEMDKFNLDNISSGRAVLNLYKETKEVQYKKAADTLRKQIELQLRTQSGGFWHKKIYPNQMWLDGLYMAEPFYAMYSSMFDVKNGIEYKKDFDDIANQFILIQEHCKDKKTGLYYHGWDESKKQKWSNPVTGTSPSFWGRAMGWYMMALVDVLDYFPKDNSKRNKLIEIVKNLSESLLKFRDKDKKLWYQVIDKGNRKGNYIEASASTMFIYAFAKGANNGYLDKKYFNIAKESFDAVQKYLIITDKEGIISLNDVVSVSGLGGKPYRDGSFEYYISEPKRVNDFKGYGPLILAAIELEN